MRMRFVASLAFFLNTVLFGTYYAVSKEALGRIDPLIFTYLEMMTLVPAGLCIIAWTWQDLTKAVVRRGILLGSSLCLALFTIAIALKYTTATATAFFPSLNGFLAALIAWMVLRQPITKATWLAGMLSVVGTALLIATAAMGGIRGSLIAFLGGLFFTGYVFLSDTQQKSEVAPWSLFGIELLTTAVWANLVMLLFGDWHSFHPALPKDIWVILYVATACTFLPTLITVLMQKHISPVTVSFIYILEPVVGAIVANVYLHETLPVDGYLGGALVLAGAVVQTWATAERPAVTFFWRFLSPRQDRAWEAHVSTSLRVTIGYPALFLAIGAGLVYGLGGFPPASWYALYRLGPQLFPSLQQGHGLFVGLLMAQGLCWLLAWLALLGMGYVVVYRILVRIFFAPKTLPTLQARQSYVADVPTYPHPVLAPSVHAPRKLVRQEPAKRIKRLEFVE